MNLIAKRVFTKKDLIISIVLLVLSVALRLYQLGNIPSGLTVDEADMGYNAYSIIKTGADVYGRRLPLFFQSLDDYKAPVGIYAAVPAIYFFGLTEQSIRLLPAILGALAPLLIFFSIKLLYPKASYFSPVAAILMIFSPWNIAVSRSNLPYIELIFFYLLFLITFLFSISKNFKFLPISYLLLGFTVYIYYASIIYFPLILILLTLIYWKNLIKKPKIWTFSFLILTVTVLPALIYYQSKESKSRLNAISIFTPDITLPVSISELQFDQQNQQIFSSIIHNRRFIYINSFLNNYFDYFNLDYLFISAANIRYFYTNYVGLFYFIEAPFFLFGLYRLIKRRNKSDLFLIGLMIMGPIPASITLGSPFPHRGILLLLAIQLIIASGVSTFLENIKKATFSSQLKWGLVMIYIVNIYIFLHQYFVHSPLEFTSENDNGAWFSTVREAIPKVNSLSGEYQKVVFTWSHGKLVPAVYFLFYNQINPQIMQEKASKQTNETPSYKQIYNEIENIEFRPINWEVDKNLQKTLFVGYPSEFPKGVQIIDRTYLPNGEPHFVFVKTK